MIPSLVWLLVAAAAAWGTRAVQRYAVRAALLDVPNARSSHTTPTPRGGGLVFALGWAGGLPALWLLGVVELSTAVALLGGGGVVAAIGWVDDHGHVPARVRLLAHFTAGAWTVGFLGGIPSLAVGPVALANGWVASAVAVLMIVWMINLYNFMDGIDGLAGLQALAGGLAIGAILTAYGATGLSAIAYGVAALSAGFLFWNWPPAAIFMGDVGSGLLGYAFAGLAVAAESGGGASSLVVLIPVGAFIADATFTLIRRALRGERFYEAHRSHVYQRLVQAGWDARSVNAVLLTLVSVLGAGAWVAARRPAMAGPVLGGATALLLLVGVGLIRVAGDRWAGDADGAG